MKMPSRNIRLLGALAVSFGVVAGAGAENAAKPNATVKNPASITVTGNERLPKGHPTMPNAGNAGDDMADHHGMMDKKVGTPTPKVVVPKSVKSRYASVRLGVTRGSEKRREITVPLGGEAALSELGLRFKAKDYLPAYTSNHETITSSSDEAKNPAVWVEVMEKGKAKGAGWVFKKFPEFNTLSGLNVRVELLDALAARK